MILNTQMTTPQSSGIMDSQQCENFYLKRKLGPEDQIDNNNGFVQPKKRHLQGYSLSENAFQSIGSDDGPQQQPDQQHQDFSTTFINDLFSYDNSLVPVQTHFSNDQFDGNWQNSDLLELDHRYNSGLAVVTSEEASQLNQDAANNNNDNGSNNVQVAMQSCASSASSQHQRETKQNLSSIFSMQNQNHQSHHRKYNSDTECDFEDKNLSWLFNFKLDELPHLSPEINQIQPTPPPPPPQQLSQQTKPAAKSNSSASENSMVKSQAKSTQVKTVKKFEELVMEVTSELDANDMVVGENVVVDNTPRMPKKPPFTYTELIEYALEDKGELTVSGIYQWISDRFPFYKSNDDRWKNSVRHNLSINPHFRKGVKAPQGAGHLWTISSGDSEENILAWEHKKQRLDLFFKMESLHRERYESSSSSRDQNQQMFDEAAIAVATITQEMNTSISSELTVPSNDHSSTSCSPSSSSISDRLGTTLSVSTTHELPFNDLITDEDLRKTAGQILNGIHRDVEVQAVNSIISTYHDSYLDTEDYLNPIHKDVSVHESGLRSELYVTEIDPIELGIQVEEEGLFNDEFNLNYFGYNAGNDIVA